MKLKQIVCDGTIYETGKDGDGAKYVKVYYPRINKRFYHWHLDTISVKKGQKVSRVSVIGIMGATGNVTGAHVHFEVRINGKCVDPTPYLP